MPRKIAIFAFNGDPMCIAHVFLNALDMAARGYQVRLVIEGSATQQVRELMDPRMPFAGLYSKVKEEGLVDCVCKACSHKFGSDHSALDQGLRLCDEMSGHPSMARYMEDGYEVIVV